MALRWGCSPAGVHERIGGGRNFVEMYECWKLDPFGVEWRQLARISRVLYEVNRTEGDPLKDEQFLALPAVDAELVDEEEQTAEEAMAALASCVEVVHVNNR